MSNKKQIYKIKPAELSFFASLGSGVVGIGVFYKEYRQVSQGVVSSTPYYLSVSQLKWK